ncbi:MAG: hypothetical protein A2373_04405 [Candidatus Magasanikbacteria bacterium RIFOXYB1_FULL_40_15]|uniref:Uncharacterized protein n=1 Tax=Candidatus Magasanikbacteria bacterium RIFOXYB1_FULL_40_15 TaxID=1798697 RepID=A0A1F6NE19_9BACT|nr:MAG: hypothetical protein A2373_04405 [Candidatus Magasanikbacteria bacterium RIFOXYB1_FULL_40_15]
MSGLPSPVKVKSRTKYDGEPQLALSELTARFFAPLFIKKVEERKLFFWIFVFARMIGGSLPASWRVGMTGWLRWGFLIN